MKGKKRLQVLEKLFVAKNHKLDAQSFDEEGNVSFGIGEHIEIPGMEYDPDIGIHGLDVTVSMERPGYRIKKRRVEEREIPKEHKLSKEESMEFFEREFNVEIVR